MKTLRIIALGAFALSGIQGLATTYYVDSASGSDSSDGRAKTSGGGHGPWAHAPGMANCTNTCNSQSINPGDSVILRGCQTWGNASFTWQPHGTGTALSPVYYGVDQTWWDSTVAGCSGGWNRPVFNLGNAPVTDSLQRIIILGNSFLTIDNFEITNISDRDSQFNGENETHVFDVYGSPTQNITVQNCYIHGWKQQFFAIGTGTLTQGSSTITNFVPLSYSPMLPSSSWTSQSKGIVAGDLTAGNIPQTGNGAQVTAISGSNPYTITWSGSGPSSGNCTACTITVGGDYIRIFVGNEGGNPGTVVQNNVIDGSDSTAALINPYGDCGLSEGNNQWCGTSGVAFWRGPQIVRNNVIRYVQSAAVGACQEWSGNLIEYIRFSTNYGVHTNAIECLDTTPGVSLMYNNVERHTNKPNPNTPGGLQSIGLFNQINPPNTASTSYIFNNVVYDTLQNNWIGFGSGTTGCQSNCGTIVMFNNTSDCGPSWNLSYACTGGASGSCPSFLKSCQLYNNHFVTSNSTPCGNTGGASCNSASGNYSGASNNVAMTPATATKNGYSEGQLYAYSPTSSGSPTVVAGTDTSLMCAAITLSNLAAGLACASDTPYGATYNTVNHTAAVGPRSTTKWSPVPIIGAYQFSSGGSLNPPTGLTATAQ